MDIALGNVVGSNLFNVLFILGVSALITPLVVHQQLIRQEVPVMVGVSLLLWALAADGGIGRGDGALLFLLVVGYTFLIIRQSRQETAAVREEYAESMPGDGNSWDQHWGAQTLLVLAGLGLLVLGSRWLVEGAVAFAQYLGVSELIIGLTIVAIGTSLPEVATSILAAIKGEKDIAVGNVVGSNIFNILAVLGVSSLVAPQRLVVAPSMLSLDIPIMVLAAVACLPVFYTGNTISRSEGALFLGYYAAYTAYLILQAIHSPILALFSLILGGLILLTFILLAALAWRYRQSHRWEEG